VVGGQGERSSRLKETPSEEEIDRFIGDNKRIKKDLTTFILSGTIVKYRSFTILGRWFGVSECLEPLLRDFHYEKRSAEEMGETMLLKHFKLVRSSIVPDQADEPPIAFFRY